MGQKATEEEVIELINNVDFDGSGEIELNEFMELMI